MNRLSCGLLNQNSYRWECKTYTFYDYDAGQLGIDIAGFTTDAMRI